MLADRAVQSGEALFGEHDLVSERAQRAPIRRVAILTEAFLPKLDGVSKTSYLTVRYLQQTGREVLVFAPDTGITEVHGSEVVALPAFSLSMAPETKVAMPIPYIEERLRAFQPDLIHLGSPALMSMYGMITARELNIPVVANYQTDLPGYAAHYGVPFLEQPIRDWLRYLHNGCHVNLAPTKTVQKALRKQGFHRVMVWGRGVNLTQFNPAHRSAAMRARLLAGRSDDHLLCIYVGRLANEKQISMLLELAKQPGIALAIVGDGAQRAELEALFEGTGTHFAGYLYGQELSEAYASADAFVFPGPNETFGQVVQEAFASGLPCIVTSKGSVAELVQHGVTGFICEQTPAAYARAATYLRDNPRHRHEMSRAARAFAETRPWSSVMSQLEDHYLTALKVSERFKRTFHTTHYHRTARLRSWAAALTLWAGSTLIGRLRARPALQSALKPS
ncbi:MAG: glycosyltransferase family 1 protein [Anaerolinea sp.]